MFETFKFDFVFKPKRGVLAILDETTRFQQGSDMSFIQQLNKNYGGNQLYTKAKGDRPEFGIRHFAAQVMLLTDNFVKLCFLFETYVSYKMNRQQSANNCFFSYLAISAISYRLFMLRERISISACTQCFLSDPERVYIYLYQPKIF